MLLTKFNVKMLVRIFNWCWTVMAVFFLTTVPLWAQEAEAEEAPVWVISYAIMIGFVTLTLLILLRPIRRSDSAFSYDELQAQKEEDMKKIKGSH